MTDQTIIPARRQVLPTSSDQWNVPAVINSAGPPARKRFIEFFTANIRNAGTRTVYLRAVKRYCNWCEVSAIPIDLIEPVIVATYIEQLQQSLAAPTVKQHLAAIRMLFDYLVTGGVLRSNPAASVKGPKVVVVKGRTPVLSAADTRHLLESIDTNKIAGLRDRALLGVLVYSFARITAALKMNIDDIYINGRRWWIRLKEKGGKFHEMPLHHNAEAYLLDYLDAGNLHGRKGVPLFQSVDRSGYLTESRLDRHNAWAMIRRRARRARILTPIGCHTFRATGITEYMRNGGTLETAQRMAAHASSRTTNLYNRVQDEISLDEVERIMI